MPEILTGYKKILYIDVDIAVCHDLGELYNTDIEGFAFAAVIDLPAQDETYQLITYKEFVAKHGFSEFDKYVNSGVALFNLEAMRQEPDKYFSNVLELAVEASKFFADQDALNFVCKGKIKLLDLKWNVLISRSIHEQLSAIRNEPCVLHYGGPANKPWRCPEVLYGYEWWHYIDFAEGVALLRRIYSVEQNVRLGEGVVVSVIMPVYNAGHYLKEMLISLSVQTLENIEIICVDDGSTDGSSLILEEASRADKRIRVIKQKNSGGATARNRGIEEARGKWLFFADADDLCKPQMLEEMVLQGEKEESDVVVAGRYVIDQANGSRQEFRIPAKYSELAGPVNSTKDGINVFEGLGFAPWNKLWRKDFVIRKALRFHQIPPNDDVFFVLSGLLWAERISFHQASYYYYRKAIPTSQMGQADKHPLNFLKALMEVKEIVADYPDSVKKQFCRVAMLSSLQHIYLCKTGQAAERILDALKNGGFEGLLFPGISVYQLKLGSAKHIYNMVISGAGVYEIMNARIAHIEGAVEERKIIRQRESRISELLEDGKRLRGIIADKDERINERYKQIETKDARIRELLEDGKRLRGIIADKDARIKAKDVTIAECKALNNKYVKDLHKYESANKELCASHAQVKSSYGHALGFILELEHSNARSLRKCFWKITKALSRILGRKKHSESSSI